MAHIHSGDGHSVGQLTKQATEQLSELVHAEFRLARAELTQKGRRAGRGGGMFGGAGVVAFVGLQALAATAIVALALVLDLWLAALIVTAVLFAIAGVLALLGRKEIRRATPPTPKRTVENVKADVREMKERAHR